MLPTVHQRRPFLTAEWRDLVIANYVVPPKLLQPLVPRGTTLDLWAGQALVSLVGFRFLATRLFGLGIPGHRDFEEVNLRFYVRRESGSETRRGVVFVRELVSRRAIAWIARAIYNEPYRTRPMRHAIRAEDGSRSTGYEWHDGRDWVGIVGATTGEPGDLEPGSKAEFITEHYWGYTTRRDGRTTEYRVAHPRWRVWESAEVRVSGNVGHSYGSWFREVLSGSPESAVVAAGSPVEVHRPRRI